MPDISNKQLLRDLPLIYRHLALQGMLVIEDLGFLTDNVPPSLPYRTQQLLQFLPHGKELLNRNLVHFNDALALSYMGFAREAEYVELSAAIAYSLNKEDPDIWTLFQKSMLSDDFPRAVIESSQQGDLRASLLDILTEDNVSDETYEQISMNLGNLSRDEQNELFKAKERKRKTKKKTHPLIGHPTKDLLLKNWLPYVLWSKSTSDILRDIPKLQTVGANAHVRDSRKVNKAINELGLTHPKHTQVFR